MAGATIGQLVKEFKLGEATIYRVLNTAKNSNVDVCFTEIEID